MEVHRPQKARITSAIPEDRVDMTLGDRKSLPEIGDIVELDHGFTMPSGKPAGIGICRNPDGSVRWIADVLESEMEVLP